MKTTIVLPTFNERENLPLMADRLLNLPGHKLSIVIVDDNSPDGTGEIADQLALKHPDRVSVIHRPGKYGLGTAYIAGFRHAIAGGAHNVIQMDADFSHDPAHIPAMLKALETNDLVVGSRYVNGASLDKDWGYLRNLLSRWGNSVYVSMLLATKVMDATGGFRAWRRSTLQGMGLDRITSNGYIFQVEMAYLAEKLGYNVTEVPIHFNDRLHGESKMDFGIQLEAMWRVLKIRNQHQQVSRSDRYRDWLRNYQGMRPQLMAQA